MATKDSERVEVWNAFLSLAREQGVAIKKSLEPEWTDKLSPNLTFQAERLSEDETRRLSLLTWCMLSIEARANHLIEERMQPQDKASSRLKKRHFENFEQKWIFLANSARQGIKLDKAPHNSVRKLQKLRNDIMHVDFEGVKERLPSAAECLDLFNDWIEAMEDMNVRLGRHPKPDPIVLTIALDC
jgi:hypothetical protein